MRHSDKKVIIESLVDVPAKGKRPFWAREIKTFNILLEKYPTELFWKNLRFPNKIETLIVLRSGFYSKELEKKYKRFHYKIPQKETVELGKVCGDDILNKKSTKTIKSFLT